MQPNEWNDRYSGGNVPGWDQGRASPLLLRLLPVVHHPPARVLVPGCGLGHDALALDNRGYDVLGIDFAPLAVERARARGIKAELADFLTSDFGGSFDLVCEHTLFCAIQPDDRDRYVQAAARALRPGGKLFGAMLDFDNARLQRPGPPFGTNASDILHRFGPYFEVERLEPSGFRCTLGSELDRQEIAQFEVVLVRR